MHRNKSYPGEQPPPYACVAHGRCLSTALCKKTASDLCKVTAQVPHAIFCVGSRLVGNPGLYTPARDEATPAVCYIRLRRKGTRCTHDSVALLARSEYEARLRNPVLIHPCSKIRGS